VWEATYFSGRVLRGAFFITSGTNVLGPCFVIVICWACIFFYLCYRLQEFGFYDLMGLLHGYVGFFLWAFFMIDV